MKTKLKGKGGIKGLFLLHGEKIAIVLVGVLALYFIYSSLQLPRLDDQYQADKLQSVVTATNAAVTDSRWPEPESPNATDVRVFKPIAKNANVPIDPKMFAIDAFQPQPLPPTQLRTDPEILPAIDLVVIGGSGVLAFRDENTRLEQERRRQLEEEERMRREQDRMAEAAKASLEDTGGRRRGRGGEEMDAIGGLIDPDKPNRRALSLGAAEGGVQLQGGERLEQASWATVLAKVPIREQLKRYQDAFEHARGGFVRERDFPRYMGFVVERSEIINGKATPWQRVQVMDGQKGKPALGPYVSDTTLANLQKRASEQWAMIPPDPVDSRYIDFMLTMPLPPLVGRQFGEDATHPDIPLAINAPPMQDVIGPEAAPEKPAEETAEEEDDTLQFGTSTQAGQAPGANFVPSQGFSGGGERGFSQRMFMGGEMGERGPYGGGMSSREFAGPMTGSGSFAAPSGGRTELPRGVDYWLVRFFDFTVQPGKKYKYRVQLVLADPNHGVPISANMLDQSVLDRKTKEAQKSKNKKPLVYRLAAASESSPAVGIPLQGGVRVAGAKLPSGKNPYEEPSVRLWAEAVEIDNAEGTAIHVAKDRDYVRGAVVNLSDKMMYTDVNKTWRDIFEDDHAINTNITVLDIEGADRVAKDKYAPTRVLLMDAGGELSIRDETDDSLAVMQLKAAFTERKGGRRPEDEMPGGFEGGFPGGRGGPRGR